MGQNEAEILTAVTSSTKSELILFFIILTVLLVVVLLPLYTLVLKDRKEKRSAEGQRQEKYIEREREIIKVITANTEVMYVLKTTLENNATITASSIVRIHERIDITAENVGQIKASQEFLKNEIREVQEVVNSILFLVNGQKAISCSKPP